MEDLGVGEGDDLNRDTLFPLLSARTLMLQQSWKEDVCARASRILLGSGIGEQTNRCAEDLRVLSVIRDNDPGRCGLCEDLFSQLTSTTTLDRVEIIVDSACQQL